MPAATSDEQLHFLLKCVKYSNSGKVTFHSLHRFHFIVLSDTICWPQSICVLAHDGEIFRWTSMKLPGSATLSVKVQRKL